MMSKIFFVLSEEDLITLESICMDKDPEEALSFVMKRVVPQVKKPLPCLAGQLMRADRR
ncbi:MAG: hypothetical protein Q7J27_00260 [Syntrophales bacterium]|nr:hypothetical protein [Syntrophales bacterium]